MNTKKPTNPQIDLRLSVDYLEMRILFIAVREYHERINDQFRNTHQSLSADESGSLLLLNVAADRLHQRIGEIAQKAEGDFRSQFEALNIQPPREVIDRLGGNASNSDHSVNDEKLRILPFLAPGDDT
jgi:hypothetical protein